MSWGIFARFLVVMPICIRMWIANDAYNCFEPFEQQTTLNCFWICIIERVIIILFKYIYCRWLNNATNRVIQQVNGDVADDDDKRNTWKGYLIFNDCNWMVDWIGWDGMGWQNGLSPSLHHWILITLRTEDVWHCLIDCRRRHTAVAIVAVLARQLVHWW